jgi:hypothetical protein
MFWRLTERAESCHQAGLRIQTGNINAIDVDVADRVTADAKELLMLPADERRRSENEYLSELSHHVNI